MFYPNLIGFLVRAVENDDDPVAVASALYHDEIPRNVVVAGCNYLEQCLRAAAVDLKLGSPEQNRLVGKIRDVGNIRGMHRRLWVSR